MQVETQPVGSILVASLGDAVEEYVRGVIGRWHAVFGLLCLLAGCVPAVSGQSFPGSSALTCAASDETMIKLDRKPATRHAILSFC